MQYPYWVCGSMSDVHKATLYVLQYHGAIIHSNTVDRLHFHMWVNLIHFTMCYQWLLCGRGGKMRRSFRNRCPTVSTPERRDRNMNFLMWYQYWRAVLAQSQKWGGYTA